MPFCVKCWPTIQETSQRASHSLPYKVSTFFPPSPFCNHIFLPISVLCCLSAGFFPLSAILMMLPSRIILTFCPQVLPPWTLCKCQCCLFCCFGFYKNVTVCFSIKHQFWKLWEGSHEGGIIQPHSRAYESTNHHTVSLNS